MTSRGLAGRLAAMDRAELRFRSLAEARKAAGRVRFGVARPRWHRGTLSTLLAPEAGDLVRQARDAARGGDYLDAHRALALHYGSRAPRWPVAAIERTALADEIRCSFPGASVQAERRADRIAKGRFDLLGYPDLAFGDPPDWQFDPVHGRRAPGGFWADVPFLSPEAGDHKVIWELNRHQHFLRLGTAFWLTGEQRYRETFIAHLENWLVTNPPLSGINWASMLELALRAISWTWAIEFFATDASGDRAPWLVDLLLGLDRQLTHVEHNLSTYFSPNTHISGEALALYAVSLALPELRRSAERAALGRAILLREAEAQVCADGGHAELSTHYHRYSTDFYLLARLVAGRTGDTAAGALEATLRAQVAYLRTLADDRGCLPNIGDEDGGQLFPFGEAPSADAATTLSAAAHVLGNARLAVGDTSAETCWILGRVPAAGSAAGAPLPWPSQTLGDSGYFVSRRHGGTHLVFDAGRHGFLNGGHAHADALSVVLTAGTHPVLVDPGTATYTIDTAMRDRFRAPRMHNTVTVDGRSFAVPDGPFHWRSTADSRLLASRTDGESDFAVGMHTGYDFPHIRAVVAISGAGWVIVDCLMPAHEVRADAWWHLHPSWDAEPVASGFRLTHASGTTLALATTAEDRAIDDEPYSPVYGLVERSSTIRTSARGSAPLLIGTFLPFEVIGGICPRIVLDTESRRVVDGWNPCTVVIDAGTEYRLRLAFPSDPALVATPDGWPQPCIQQRRAVCAE